MQRITGITDGHLVATIFSFDPDISRYPDLSSGNDPVRLRRIALVGNTYRYACLAEVSMASVSAGSSWFMSPIGNRMTGFRNPRSIGVVTNPLSAILMSGCTPK